MAQVKLAAVITGAASPLFMLRAEKVVYPTKNPELVVTPNAETIPQEAVGAGNVRSAAFVTVVGPLDPLTVCVKFASSGVAATAA